MYSYRISFQDNNSFSFAPGIVSLSLGTSHVDELTFIFRIDPSFYDIPHGNWSEGNLRHSSRLCDFGLILAKFENLAPDEE